MIQNLSVVIFFRIPGVAPHSPLCPDNGLMRCSNITGRLKGLDRVTA
jgi:hypothetical protein